MLGGGLRAWWGMVCLVVMLDMCRIISGVGIGAGVPIASMYLRWELYRKAVLLMFLCREISTPDQ